MRLPSRLAFRRLACAWLGIASLFGLLLLESTHGSLDTGRAHTEGSHTVVELLASDAHAPLHDTGSCQVCRAASQIRSGLRDAAQPASPQSLLQALHPAVEPELRSAPDLRDAWPRAPPSPLAA
jgi:hypothetical protein